jgi:hypothetical protein
MMKPWREKRGKYVLNLGIGRHGGCIKRRWLLGFLLLLSPALLSLAVSALSSFLVKGGQALVPGLGAGWSRATRLCRVLQASFPEVAIGCVTSRRQKHSTRCRRSSQRLVRMQGVLAFLSHN